MNYHSDKNLLIDMKTVNIALEQVYGSKLKNTGIQDFIQLEDTSQAIKSGSNTNTSNYLVLNFICFRNESNQ